MKKDTVPILIVCLVIFVGGCGPDIIVSDITAGTPYLDGDSAVLPLSVTVANVGDSSASQFKAAVLYQTASTGPYVVAFDVPGQQSLWYPYTNGSLAAGGEETFEGLVLFNSTVHGSVDLWAEADSCSGDEFMPDYCRVEESNESNNESDTISVSLP